MDIKTFIRSKKFKIALSIIGIAIVALLIFQIGMFAGYRKAEFSFRMGEHYYNTFGGPRRMPPIPPHDEFPDPHGASGKIIQISLPTFVLEGQDGIEKVVVIKEDTAIRRFREIIQSADLKINDVVVVIGTPNEQSQIEAKLIRVLPSIETRKDTDSRTK